VRPVVHLIPHTHWDREWYLPAAVFRRRLVRMMDELIRMLERHRSLRFTLDGQTILPEDYLAIRPAMRPRFERLVRRGRLAIGPWYVLADELIPSPASLRANLRIGLGQAATLGGAMPVLYSPDAFGHPGYLPDLAVEVGIRHGVVWRGLGDQETNGRDLIVWRGPGGGRLLLHHLPREGYEIGAHLPSLSGRALAEAWGTLEPRLAARSATRHLALPIGADHHAAHPRLPRLAAALARADRRYRFRFSRWEEYFAEATRELSGAPEVCGELRSSCGYTWTLQGVHGSRARMKRLHALAERRLRDELYPLVLRHGDASDRAIVDDLDRTLIRCQFHDTIAGTVCDAANRTQLVRLEGLVAAVGDLTREILLRGQGGRGLLLHNPSGRGRRGIVVAEITRFRRDVLVGPPDGRVARVARSPSGFSLRDERGRPVPIQVLDRRVGLRRLDRRLGYPDLDEVDRVSVAIDLGRVAPGATRRLSLGPTETARPVASGSGVDAGRRWVENRLLRAELSRSGVITVIDRRNDRRYPGLLAIEAERDRGDLYTPSLSAVRIARKVGVPRVAAAGALLSALEVGWQLTIPRHGRVEGVTRIELRREAHELRCRLELDHRGRELRLRLGFPISVRGPAVVGTGEGLIARPAGAVPGGDLSGEAFLPTAPGHDLVSVGTRREGLTILHDGHFEYQWEPGAGLWLTLLRSVGQLSRADLPERPGHAAWPVATPDAQEAGPHRVDFRVRPGGLGVRSPYPESGGELLVAQVVGEDGARDHD